MKVAKVEVERFSLTSLKPFDTVVATLKSAIGQPNMPDFFQETRATTSFRDLERVERTSCYSPSSIWATFCAAKLDPKRPMSCAL